MGKHSPPPPPGKRSVSEGQGSCKCRLVGVRRTSHTDNSICFSLPPCPSVHCVCRAAGLLSPSTSGERLRLPVRHGSPKGRVRRRESDGQEKMVASLPRALSRAELCEGAALGEGAAF